MAEGSGTLVCLCLSCYLYVSWYVHLFHSSSCLCLPPSVVHRLYPLVEDLLREATVVPWGMLLFSCPFLVETSPAWLCTLCLGNPGSIPTDISPTPSCWVPWVERPCSPRELASALCYSPSVRHSESNVAFLSLILLPVRWDGGPSQPLCGRWVTRGKCWFW